MSQRINGKINPSLTQYLTGSTSFEANNNAKSSKKNAKLIKAYYERTAAKREAELLDAKLKYPLMDPPTYSKNGRCL